MKGIILAGGNGTRLAPLTNYENKHMLPVAMKPMIDYPIETLLHAGITDIMVVVGGNHYGNIFKYLGSGKFIDNKRICNFTYRVQDRAGGIGEALNLCKEWAGSDDVAVILGDNYFDKICNDNIKYAVESFSKSGFKSCLFTKAVDDPERFGVVDLDSNHLPVIIVEKPSEPSSNYAVVGCYIYNKKVWEYIDEIKYSDRGEMEITDVNNAYLNMGESSMAILKGYWRDCGTPRTYFEVNQFICKKNES
jgi:glucose-1-phosphate thymidylyltransferase